MKISVDNQVIRLFSNDRVPLKLEENHRFSFSWPTLLEYLGLGDLLAHIRPFDHTQVLFQATLKALCEVDNPEDLFYIYDSLFTEMINRVKAIAQINPQVLLTKIEERKDLLGPEHLKVLTALVVKEKELKSHAPNVMHDLILYLSWDRMCVCMGRLFDYPSSHPLFLQNLKKLKWCLMESYQHIVSQKRTAPSFYRLIEALFYYQVREEHLQLYEEADWMLLNQSFSVLKQPNEYPDCDYIDCVIAEEGPTCHLTLEPPLVVERRLDLAKYMTEHLKRETPQWTWSLRPSNVIYLAFGA